MRTSRLLIFSEDAAALAPALPALDRDANGNGPEGQAPIPLRVLPSRVRPRFPAMSAGHPTENRMRLAQDEPPTSQSHIPQRPFK